MTIILSILAFIVVFIGLVALAIVSMEDDTEGY